MASISISLSVLVTGPTKLKTDMMERYSSARITTEKGNALFSNERQKKVGNLGKFTVFQVLENTVDVSLSSCLRGCE